MDYEDMKAFRSQHISSRNAESMTSSMPLRTKVLLGTPRGTRVRNAAPERVYIPSPERNGQNAQSTKPFTFPEPQYFLFRPADLQSVPCPALFDLWDGLRG